jgi:hypothetical protein
MREIRDERSSGKVGSIGVATVALSGYSLPPPPWQHRFRGRKPTVGEKDHLVVVEDRQGALAGESCMAGCHRLAGARHRRARRGAGEAPRDPIGAAGAVPLSPRALVQIGTDDLSVQMRRPEVMPARAESRPPVGAAQARDNAGSGGASPSRAASPSRIASPSRWRKRVSGVARVPLGAWRSSGRARGAGDGCRPGEPSPR